MSFEKLSFPYRLYDIVRGRVGSGPWTPVLDNIEMLLYESLRPDFVDKMKQNLVRIRGRVENIEDQTIFYVQD